ncbi:hypothetical protein LAZ40_04065 [Cereibacter sphaeroides]|uniref:hypothetical protein n=1 Tax=Rhodobacterales TaxID=204455 RepID=UPI001E440F78|nr:MULTISPECIES: hypothetical protein [Paracoccaceae]MCE6958229.1 hypothetical protein [Cereibacter sphaeroides]MCE6967708.1 hypothetical protein [Cereibacter sphaeroides]MCE6972519.1 hypothetical protein [Cereibacter sphaeroides]
MSMSVDPNLADFQARIARIEAAHARGFGFEAEGTLGRSHYARPMRRKPRVVAPLLVLLVCGMAMKGAILWRIGPDSYQSRVDQLAQGEGFDRVGSLLMQADPVTRMVAAGLARVLVRV